VLVSQVPSHVGGALLDEDAASWHQAEEAGLCLRHTSLHERTQVGRNWEEGAALAFLASCVAYYDTCNFIQSK